MTDNKIKILWRVFIVLLSIFIWIRPLFFAYHHPVFFDTIQFVLLGICIILSSSISIKLKPLRFNGFLILVLAMLIYPAFHKQLASNAEEIFFKMRQNRMEAIVDEINNNPLNCDSKTITRKINKLQIDNIEADENYIAFAVNNFLDNTDGFLYLKNGEFPLGLFDGKVVYKKYLDGRWYSFSTR